MKRTMICLLLFMGQTLAQGAGQVVAVRAGHLVDPATASVTDNQLILVKDGKILWHFNTGQRVESSPMAYTVDGHERLVLITGQTVVSYGIQ